jgi:uncharacterized protein
MKHEEAKMDFYEKPVVIESEAMQLGAAMTVPRTAGRVPAVILAGGSLSQLRDGELMDVQHPGPQRKAMKLLAHRLVRKGFASIRYDKPGYGQSRFSEKRFPHTGDHVAALQAVYEFLQQYPVVDSNSIIIAGESAGAYYTCLLAKKGVAPRAYALLGALGSGIEELYQYNYERTAAYAMQSPDKLRWVAQVAPKALALGLHYREMFAKALAGEEFYTLAYKEHIWEMYLPPTREQLEQQPLPLFGFLKRPVVIMQGQYDMNVPPGDAEIIENRLRESGNTEVVREIIPEADHNFQMAPGDSEERMRERISLSCLTRPYSDIFYHRLVVRLKTILSESERKKNNESVS